MSKYENKLVTGIKPRSYDRRDFLGGALYTLPRVQVLPDEYLLTPLSVKDQNTDGNYDFCASCAGAALKEQQEGVELFYPFLFAAAKHEQGGDPDDFGLELRSIGKALVKWGIPAVSDVPQEIKDLPMDKRRRFEHYPQELRDKALLHKGAMYFFVEGPYDPYDNYRATMVALKDKKIAPIFGIIYGWPLEEYLLVYNGTPQGFGHSMSGQGWDTQGVAALNSAGMQAGHNGMHRISRETFNRAAKRFGVLVVTDMPERETKESLMGKSMEWDWKNKNFAQKLWVLFKQYCWEIFR